MGYGYDSTGRVSQVSGWTSGFETKDYATGILYAPQGAPKSIPLHIGLTATAQFNNRLQAMQVAPGTVGLPASVWGIANCCASTDNAGCVTATDLPPGKPHKVEYDFERFQGTNHLMRGGGFRPAPGLLHNKHQRRQTCHRNRSR